MISIRAYDFGFLISGSRNAGKSQKMIFFIIF